MNSGHDIKATVLKAVELVKYQNDSVVSRTLIKKKNGTVTLFAFDKNQGLSQHTVPFDALIEVIEGKAEITINQKQHQLSAGEMIIMPANQPHAVKAADKFKMLLIMVKK